MTAGLFSEVELEDTSTERLVGYRLDRLEVLNWGTFHGQVWSFCPRGATSLLTGDIGSGKSTLVDALTTLLLPAHRVAYNKAAGAAARERDLRSYVLGYYKSERNETTGTTRPIGLRQDGRSHSVLLATFTNPAVGATLTLAQVFWTREPASGQPERFFAVAERDLSIAEDFVGFGGEIATLRKRLRAGGVRVHERFAEYGRDARRLLGIPSEQALDLFHQTVSMKAVTDLNDFVRTHMLEPFDAKAAIETLITHFDDLTRAHDAVVRARAQLEALTPLLAECDAHDALAAAVASLGAQREALTAFAAGHRRALLAALLEAARADLDAARSLREQHSAALAGLEERRRALDIERAGLGGTTLAELERRLGEAAQTRDRRRDKAHRFDLLTAELGLPPLSGQAHHGELLRQVHASAEQGQQARAVAETERESATVAKGRLEAEAAEVNAELRSLSQRPNNIPRRSLELRERLCDELGVDPEELPFAGELIQVRDDAREWEGAAERVLHGFALSLLVPHHRYPAVSEWIDANHLGIRLVYHRVPETLAPQRVRPEGDQQQLRLVDLLEVRADSAFGSWLNRELEHRADHVCAATMAEFRRLRKAVTRAGQVRHDNRHEKNDERAVGDRRWYVLGWSSARKVDVLLEHAARLHGDLAAAAERLRQAGQALARLDARITTVRLLTTEFADYTDLDWESLVAQIARDSEAKRQIEESSRDLERVTEELAAVVAQLDHAGNERAGVDRRIGDLENSERTWAAQVAETEAVLEGATPAAAAVTTALGARLPAEPFTQPWEVDRWEVATGRAITVESDRRRERQAVAVRRALALMHAFRGSYPVETTEMDAAVEAAPAYRELAQRLRDDDLPRFEAEFKTYLNTNTIREIATFQSSLQRQVELIRERVDKINSSLVSIDYNPGRYIRLEALATPNVEIRDFRSELLACTDDVLTGGTDDDQYSEAKFAQVQRIIERFRGRVGQTEADRAWTTRVTDVRNWFLFTASERWRDDDREHESYADSAGKSGGQKEKLAYTILAASLAYQFRLDWGVTSSRTFRFVVIDEAFGRGSDESTRFALGLFRTLNLQLLIVTPLQKIHVIEPYVAAVGFVDNRTGSASRLQTLTIEEVRSRRAKRGAR